MFMVKCIGGEQSGNIYVVNTTADLVDYVALPDR